MSIYELVNPEFEIALLIMTTVIECYVGLIRPNIWLNGEISISFKARWLTKCIVI